MELRPTEFWCGAQSAAERCVTLHGHRGGGFSEGKLYHGHLRFGDIGHTPSLHGPPLKCAITLPRGLRFGSPSAYLRARRCAGMKGRRYSCMFAETPRNYRRPCTRPEARRHIARSRAGTARFLGAGVPNLLKIFNRMWWCSRRSNAAATPLHPLRAEVKHTRSSRAFEAPHRAGRASFLSGAWAIATFKMQTLASLIRGGHILMRVKAVGVMGSVVWDVIHGRDPRDAGEEWVGIT